MIYQNFFDDDVIGGFVNDVIDGVMGFANEIDAEVKRSMANSNSNSNNEGFNITATILTDVTEYDDRYVFALELPGYEKSDIKIDLKKGNLTVEAEHVEPIIETKTTEGDATVEKAPEEKYIKKERFTGKKKRSFFVGNDVAETDISAKLENGILKIVVPKVEPKKEEKQYINID